MSTDIKNQNADTVSKLAIDVAHGFNTYIAVMTIAKDERKDSLIPSIDENEPADGFINNPKTGDSHSFIFKY